MELEDYNYEKNSNTITQEERLAFVDRFKRACRARGMTLQQVQNMLGKSNAYFRNMGYISPKIAVEVKKVIPDLNIEYINKGVGQMFVSQAEVDAEEQKETKKANTIPLLPISARGGTLTGFSEGLNVDDCELITSPIAGAELAITINDDTMAPEYPLGCEALVKKVNEQAFIEWGKAYVIDTCNGIIMKKIYPVKDDKDKVSKVLCRSVNKDYPDFMVNFTDTYGFYKVLMQMSVK